MILSLALAAALPEASTTAVIDAQRRFRAAIEASVVLDTRFTTASTGSCQTSYATLSPGRTPAQVLPGGFHIDWRKVVDVTFVPGAADAKPWWRNWVKVSIASGYYPVHVAPEQVGPLMAAANDLIRLCRPVPAGPVAGSPSAKPAPAGYIADRVPGGKEAFTGLDLCRFRSVPGLVLVRRSEVMETPARASYEVRSAEDGGVSFVVRAQETPNRKGRNRWDALLPWPGFDVYDGWRMPAGATQASILLDGRKSAFTVGRTQNGSSRQDPSFLLQNPLDKSLGGLTSAIKSMDGNSMLTWQFLDGAGRVLASYNFDIRTLRKMPDAIIASNWACS
jgi:hypothetical protein